MQTLNESRQIDLALKRERYTKDIALFAMGGDELCVEDKYQLFVTAHFGKSNQVSAEHHCKHFRNVIDRRVLRSSQRLYKTLWLEQGAHDSYNAIHAHWIFEAPKHMTINEFEDLFKNLWFELCGSKNIVFKQIDTQLGGVSGLINYCTKETAYGNYGTFIETLSDNTRHQKSRHSLQQIKALQQL